MENLRVTSRKLTDGSEVFAVKFTATHGDNKPHTVTLECTDATTARLLMRDLDFGVSYAETDA